MDMLVMGALAFIALMVFGNMRFIVACMVIGVAGGLYYQQLSTPGKKAWRKTYQEYCTRCSRAFKAFRQPL